MSKEIFNPEYMISMPSLGQPMVLAALLSCIITTAALAIIWFTRRRWFLQPSLLMFVAFHLRIQWPSLLFFDWAAEHLPHPWDFFLLTQFFPLVYLAAMASISTCRDSTLREFAERLRRQLLGSNAWPRGLLYFCLAVSSLTLCVIFFFVPFRSTAIYALLYDPRMIGTARSLIWTQLPSRSLVYLIGWNSYAIGPVLLFGAVYYIVNRQQRWRKLAPAIIAFIIASIALILPGNRSGFALLPIMSFAAYYCAKCRMPSKVAMCIGALIVLALPAFVSLRREGRDWTVEKQFEYIHQLLTHRIMTIPVITGALYTFDAQSTGYLGAAGFRPLAILMRVEHKAMAKRIGREYAYGTSESHVNSNAIFLYYKIMGLFCIPFTVAGLLCFDLLLVFLRRPSIAILPFVVFFIARSFQASETSLTVVFATGGFWLIPVFVFFSMVPHVPDADELPQTPNLPPKRPAKMKN